MPRQPEVHFRLKIKDMKAFRKLPKAKQDKIEEEFLIYLHFIYSGQRLFYSFGRFIKPVNWDFKKEVVINKGATNADGTREINTILAGLKSICEKGIKGVTPSPEMLRGEMDKYINQHHIAVSNEVQAQKLADELAKPTLFKLINRFIAGEIKIGVGKKRGRDKGESCLKNYNTTYQRLKDFEKAKKYPIDFDTITKDFFDLYVTYLTKVKELKPNTIAKDIATIKVFMNEAVDRELTVNLHFKKKSFSYGEEETDHVYLNEQDLNQLYRFDFSNNKRLEQVRDLFIFGCWVGLRISDYSNIKPENIKQVDGEYYIDMNTQKTGERVIIPCNPVVLEIFKKYAHNANHLPKTITAQPFNRYLKEACRMAGEDKVNPVKSMLEKGRLNSNPDLMLWETVSSHTARRSMITNYYLQGFPSNLLMRISGHRTEANFRKYLRVSEMDTAQKLSEHIKKNWSAMMLRVA